VKLSEEQSVSSQNLERAPNSLSFFKMKNKSKRKKKLKYKKIAGNKTRRTWYFCGNLRLKNSQFNMF
jgi:lysozyme family protein